MSLIPDAHHPFLSSWSCPWDQPRHGTSPQPGRNNILSKVWETACTSKQQRVRAAPVKWSCRLFSCNACSSAGKKLHGWRSCMAGHAAHGRPSRRWIPTLLRDEIGQDPATARHDPHTRGLAQSIHAASALLRLAPWVGLLSVCSPEDESKGTGARASLSQGMDGQGEARRGDASESQRLERREVKRTGPL
ncbi:hypothetical protein BDP81DRAFT_6103 [Colletotrichum phormii]|uniref:Uncharacterized protein n=1 Tax=Colletotrichum phormii TaxID=359342 RepID=A0AAJ0EKU4_9PEZI|nr:uncharacterized protein BDP81DRAFT_6103 [Colletotrichum phormii]KAK1655561.1 hypothetical protein BDP81DRAFT_6103 [Colletotrichum phormii]